MSTIIDKLQEYIRKLVKPLRDEEDVIEVLKKRLTKKEYKLINAMALDIDELEVMQSLNLDRDEYEKLIFKLIKKLNQEKLKQELMV